MLTLAYTSQADSVLLATKTIFELEVLAYHFRIGLVKKHLNVISVCLHQSRCIDRVFFRSLRKQMQRFPSFLGPTAERFRTAPDTFDHHHPHQPACHN